MAQWMMHLPHTCEGLGSDLQKPHRWWVGLVATYNFRAQGEGTGVSVERWHVRLNCLKALPMDVYVHPDIQTHAWKKRGRCLGLGAQPLWTGLMPPSWKRFSCLRSDLSYKSHCFTLTPPLPLLPSARVCKALSWDRKLPNKFLGEFAFTRIGNEHVKTTWAFWYCPLFPALQVVSLLSSFLSPDPTLPPWYQTD